MLLRDQRDLAAKLVRRQVGQRHPAHGDGTGPGRVDAGEQPAEGRLAGAGRSDDGQPLPRPDVQVDVVQHIAAFAVGEADPVHRDVLAGGPGRRRGRGRRPAGRAARAQQPGQRRAALLQLREPEQQVVHRTEDLLHVQGGGGDRGQRGEPVNVEQPADHQRRHDRHDVGGVDDRQEHRLEPQHVPLRRERGRDVGVHPLEPPVRDPQRLDGTGALHGLGQPLGELRVGRAPGQERRTPPAQVPPRGAPQGGYRDQARYGQQRAHQHDAAECDHDRGHRDHGVRYGVPRGLQQHVHVAGGARDEVA